MDKRRLFSLQFETFQQFTLRHSLLEIFGNFLGKVDINTVNDEDPEGVRQTGDKIGQPFQIFGGSSLPLSVEDQFPESLTIKLQYLSRAG